MRKAHCACDLLLEMPFIIKQDDLLDTHVELLAPAGNLDKLKLALAYGADAVYGGTSSFSLRNRSGKEFDAPSFAEGIAYAHARGKQVYCTVNGFPFHAQLGSYERHIAAMAELKPDAFIVASPGVVRMVRSIAPEIPIHLSTQANVMNVYDAHVYAEMGVRRIIAAREISLRDLEAIKHALPQMELEVFVHGAMCFAYSGRCLISALQTGRVPNRGSCANDCRFPYELYAHNRATGTTFLLEEHGVGTYIMNAKDLNLAAHIDEILSSGIVDSLKIEGRTKSSYYVGIVTRAYRHAIDDWYAGVFEAGRYQAELETTQNRGFTDAYLISRPFERTDTQSTVFTIRDGTHQVAALVREDGQTWRCKDKTCVGDRLEIVLPVGAVLAPIEHDYGTITFAAGTWWLTIKKLVATDGKTFACIHSGDLHDILLPAPVPGYTILRRDIQEAKAKKGLRPEAAAHQRYPQKGEEKHP